MASIEKITSKDGVSYRITVSAGKDYSGKRIRYRKIWHPPENVHTDNQIKKALQREVADFEREIEQGYQLDYRLTFAEYATKVVAQKQANGELEPTTAARYKELFARIFSAIGHIKLTDIRPQHLRDFYQSLQAAGVRATPDTAIAKPSLKEFLEDNRISRASIARKANLSGATVGIAVSGKSVYARTANAIAEALDVDATEYFEFHSDSRPLSSKTVLEHHRLISSVLSQAEMDMLVPYNAASKVKPPKVVRKDPNYFQPDQVREIRAELEKEPLKWHVLVLLMIVTGCRRGEIMGLKWEKVYPDRNMIYIDGSLKYTPDTGVVYGQTKTKQARMLIIPEQAMSLLMEYQQEQQILREANGDRWIESGFVFTGETGRHMHPDTATNWLADFAERHNLEHINPHAFRHTVASILLVNGIDPGTVSKQLGHALLTTTATFYAHLIDEMMARNAKCITDVLMG